MLVGGAGVARGYLNRAELTAERFVANVFGGKGRLYRSGDLARELPNGELEYLGRIDHQVKIRGFRVELSEIESVLARHPEVAECAVIARQDEQGEARLVAYVAPVAGAAPGIEALREHLAHALPDYMAPGAFVFLPKFPLTVNGKLDRGALPAPGAGRPRLASAYAAPESELEKKVAGLWGAALRQTEVGVDDSFFDLGGDSLLLTAVHMELQKALKREIPITDLFQYPTIRRLAQHLGREKGDSGLAAQVAGRAMRQREALARKQLSKKVP
jgi:acyl carrier protein